MNWGKMENKTADGFILPFFSWDHMSPKSKGDICSLLDCGPETAKRSFDLYFGEFYPMHKIGHMILHLYDDNHNKKPGRTEYCASLFAYKYLLEKSEQEALSELTSLFQSFLQRNSRLVNYNLGRIDEEYAERQKDLASLFGLHCALFCQCVGNQKTLSDVVGQISNHNLTAFNHTIVWQKGLRGMDLVRECLFYVFELNGVMPNIQVQETQELTRSSLDLTLI
jgi:hypothetical protein